MPTKEEVEQMIKGYEEAIERHRDEIRSQFNGMIEAACSGNQTGVNTADNHAEHIQNCNLNLTWLFWIKNNFYAE